MLTNVYFVFLMMALMYINKIIIKVLKHISKTYNYKTIFRVFFRTLQLAQRNWGSLVMCSMTVKIGSTMAYFCWQDILHPPHLFLWNTWRTCTIHYTWLQQVLLLLHTEIHGLQFEQPKLSYVKYFKLIPSMDKIRDIFDYTCLKWAIYEGKITLIITVVQNVTELKQSSGTTKS